MQEILLLLWALLFFGWTVSFDMLVLRTLKKRNCHATVEVHMMKHMYLKFTL